MQHVQSRLAPSAAQRIDPLPELDAWRWRFLMAERLARALDPGRFGVRAVYLFGSTKNATAGAGSDIDLLVHVEGSPTQEQALRRWLERWSLALAEANRRRTGVLSPGGLLDAKVIRDADIARRSSYAVKIGAVTDAARRLPLGFERDAS